MLFELLKDHESGMSKFQDDYFVTMRNGGTLYGQYKQALRELYKRYRGLREQIFGRRRLEIEISQATDNAKNFRSKYDQQMAAVDRDEKIAQREEADRLLADTKREFINFYSQAVAYKEYLGELTPERCEQLEREMWEFKCKEFAAVDIITQGRITSGTLDLLRSFPYKMNRRVLTEIKNHEQLILWYEDNAEQEYPIKQLSCEQVLKELL